jgi:hypothetical protein
MERTLSQHKNLTVSYIILPYYTVIYHVLPYPIAFSHIQHYVILQYPMLIVVHHPVYVYVYVLTYPNCRHSHFTVSYTIAGGVCYDEIRE